MNHKKQLFTTILFYGSLWGILEATLGYLLHFVPSFLAGAIMFPVASVLLFKAYQRTNSKGSLLAIGLVAALIKSVNLIMPQYNLWKTINPMVSIVFESLMVFAVIAVLDKKTLIARAGALFAASIGWRVLYLGYMGGQYALTGFLANHLKSFDAAFGFAVIEGVASGALALGLLILVQTLTRKLPVDIPIKPTFAGLLMAVALVVTRLL